MEPGGGSLTRWQSGSDQPRQYEAGVGQISVAAPTATIGPWATPVGEPPFCSSVTASTVPSPNLALASGVERDLGPLVDRDDAHRDRRLVALDVPELEVLVGHGLAGERGQPHLPVAVS